MFIKKLTVQDFAPSEIILKLYLFCPQPLHPVKKKQYWK